MVMARRGEIWLYNPDPVIGREQAGRRSGLILSVDGLNLGPRDLVLIAPLTTRIRDYVFRVTVNPDHSGLPVTSQIMVEQLRSISRRRLLGSRPVGIASSMTMDAVEDQLALIFDLARRDSRL